MAARVVDFPLPVGPVTNTSPRGRPANRRATSGRPSSSMVGTPMGMARTAAPQEPRCWKTLTRNREIPGTLYAKSISRRSRKTLICSGVIMLSMRAWAPSAVRAGRSSRWCSFPFTRRIGWFPTLRCRSDAPRSLTTDNSCLISMLIPPVFMCPRQATSRSTKCAKLTRRTRQSPRALPGCEGTGSRERNRTLPRQPHGGRLQTVGSSQQDAGGVAREQVEEGANSPLPRVGGVRTRCARVEGPHPARRPQPRTRHPQGRQLSQPPGGRRADRRVRAGTRDPAPPRWRHEGADGRNLGHRARGDDSPSLAGPARVRATHPSGDNARPSASYRRTLPYSRPAGGTDHLPRIFAARRAHPHCRRLPGHRTDDPGTGPVSAGRGSRRRGGGDGDRKVLRAWAGSTSPAWRARRVPRHCDRYARRTDRARVKEKYRRNGRVTPTVWMRPR